MKRSGAPRMVSAMALLHVLAVQALTWQLVQCKMLDIMHFETRLSLRQVVGFLLVPLSLEGTLLRLAGAEGLQ